MVWHDLAYGTLAADAKLAEHLDGRVYRAAAIVDGAIEGCLCIGPSGLPLSFDAGSLDVHDDSAPLALTTNAAMLETEPVVCACFGVGADSIRKAVSSGGARNVAEIGEATCAGTNCGSCLPELRRIIGHERANERAAHPG